MSTQDNGHPKASQVRSTLRGLISGSGGAIQASAAMTTDGLIIGSALGANIDEDVFAAMNASLLVLADRASSEVDIGELKQVMVMGTRGVMLLTHIGLDAVLALATDPSANLGKVLLDANRTVQKLYEILDDKPARATGMAWPKH
ncbi:roadblock/LC7 domain-containing protein [Parathalassolituus penaei]|uniref:Roadblock/LC7 domain-containing protein n=1 Tax=Parathalassolituus penaei TaxID=2997323 RepID=A0A9X3EBK0_9GAMM|nr:roadblock/LC7 domain-containing protein [Parathalassolituus penaei]MCY0964527.1 roadblock/LC7 domain-containing protein [Parathalassolituus penaei]